MRQVDNDGQLDACPTVNQEVAAQFSSLFFI